MTRLRILHVDLHLSWGGGQRQVWLLARALARRGHVQWVATPPGSVLGERSREAGLEVLTIPHRREIDPRGVWRMARLVRRLEPDIVHAHEAHALTHAALAARLGRPRLGGPRPAVVAHRRVVFPIRRGLLSRWKYARGADRVIAIGREAEGALVARGVSAARIAIVPSGIDPGETGVPGEAPSLRARIGAPAGAPLVLTIASLIPAKDHPTLIEAAARLRARDPATRWIVLGGGSLRGDLEARVARRGLADRVHYLGFLPEARAMLPEADLFALLSASEGLGTSLLDAMAAGVPVVATRAGGIPEIVEHEVTGLLAPVGDPSSIAAAVDRLLDDPALGQRLAAAARERAREFDIERTVEATERVYREAIHEARGA